MRVARAPSDQAADVPLDDEDAEAEEDAEDDAAAAGFDSEPDVAEDDPLDVPVDPDALAVDVDGVLLDEEPRLSFR